SPTCDTAITGGHIRVPPGVKTVSLHLTGGILMSTIYVIVTVVGAAMVAFSAGATFLRADFVVLSLTDYGVPQSWLPWLSTAKAAGAAGLLVGLFVPVIGVIAAAAVVLYFVGAVITVARARWYSHIVFPLLSMAPVLGALVLALPAGVVHA